MCYSVTLGGLHNGVKNEMKNENEKWKMKIEKWKMKNEKFQCLKNGQKHMFLLIFEKSDQRQSCRRSFEQQLCFWPLFSETYKKLIKNQNTVLVQKWKMKFEKWKMKNEKEKWKMNWKMKNEKFHCATHPIIMEYFLNFLIFK